MNHPKTWSKKLMKIGLIQTIIIIKKTKITKLKSNALGKIVK